ncbi:MAG: heavy metal translocating P-type ATPase [Alteromonadaceae bacterium]|nr:heavy metal translocating P-type ATPase [Alteromonadaceae bacterium]
MTTSTEHCFHCGEIVPQGFHSTVIINNKTQIMCCLGCEAVAQTIVDNNLTDYYRFRTENAQKSAPLIPEILQRHQLLDDDELQNEFTHQTEHYKETILSIDGISCAACAWLIEQQLTKMSGLININVNATTQRATVRWQNKKLKLSSILNTIEKLGYQATPFKASDVEKQQQKQNKNFIKRLGIAGILMMQIMMIAVGLYFGAFSGMLKSNLIYLRWTSFFLCLPIVFYSALPFYKGAYNALKIKHLSMDVPVSLAIILAFIASSWATFTTQGEVYFESVAMFTFLLLIGKYLEFRARSRAAEVSANLLKLMPMTAIQLINGKEQLIAAKKLQPLDIILIKPGETIPADGMIITGNSQVNEAMLSGEQNPVNKNVGDNVFCGTINSDGNLTVEIKQVSSHTFLSQLIRLSEYAQAHKPKLAKLSDTIAQYFVALILLTASATAVYWHFHSPEQAFWIALSVLVATCPCALSLATPTALTCATTCLNRHGIMIKSAHVMETLPKINCFAFDKTGTLTTGKFQLKKTTLISNTIIDDRVQILAIAACLETHSEHPIAKAFAQYRDFSIQAQQIKVKAGYGIEGVITQQNSTKIIYKIGKPSWLLSINEPINQETSELAKQYVDAQCVLVANKNGQDQLIAAFYFSDQIRDDATILINKLKSKQINTLMLSGDNMTSCEAVANTLSLDKYYAALSAQDKLTLIKQQQQTHIVAMVGDGINDSPVFGAAHIAIAMGSGSDITKSGADVILLNNQLKSINFLKHIAQKTKKIIMQNYLWAFGYNALVLPLAASGYITPYMAVIGMSASSLLVITNSLRLLKNDHFYNR